ncbi:hypothetical protein EC973_004925 [Apophysomyces ossiformis]|uniref:Uncharacterized protein n=1 Tax=Apophysomyces ossiformis TaxID=679940 RepID=A0A8H7BZJ6_9FUNG|nr:hypothetical protein EC973_004925 [Apophysomyces ossiformis]
MKFAILASLFFIAAGVQVQALPVDTVANVLSKAGFTAVKTPNQCRVCKGVCNRLTSGKALQTCKYDLCIKLLAGVKTDDPKPSCSIVVSKD